MGFADFMTKVNNLDPVHKELFGSGSGESQRSLPIDPRLKEIADQQRTNANEFDANRSAFKREGADQAAAEMRRQLAAEMRGNAVNSSQRGLLHSGLRGHADANSRYKAAVGTAAGAQATNVGVDAMGNQLDLDATNTAMKKYGLEMETAKSSYEETMERMANSKKGLGLLSSLGGAVGGMMGGMGGGGGGEKQPKAGKPEKGYAAPDNGSNFSGYA